MVGEKASCQEKTGENPLKHKIISEQHGGLRPLPGLRKHRTSPIVKRSEARGPQCAEGVSVPDGILSAVLGAAVTVREENSLMLLCPSVRCLVTCVQLGLALEEKAPQTHLWALRDHAPSGADGWDRPIVIMDSAGLVASKTLLKFKHSRAETEVHRG